MSMSPRLLRPRASGGGFNPKSIAGLVGWWDAADTSTGNITLNGGNVSQWRDKSTLGNNLIQDTALNQPTYVASSLNGKAGIDWGPVEGTAKRLSKESISVTVRDFFIVADWDGGASSTTFGSVFTASGVGQPIGLDTATGGVTWRQFANASLVSVNNAANSNVALPTIANPFVLRNTVTTSGTATAFHAGQFSSFATRGWPGKIYEILIYNSSLGSSQASAVQQYLSQKWGITLA
jgi:hypothetical protein